ncbi:transmembrane protein 165-like [Stegodyphus dumicola]|uniref:transmembrane protein 165-like n=1 Tax=Stegodyphus dumicola TaxID=202533 RepID=UPI0015B2C34D|nr:transmembrane protein 165-like [Stegodyphus dumicola]
MILHIVLSFKLLPASEAHFCFLSGCGEGLTFLSDPVLYMYDWQVDIETGILKVSRTKAIRRKLMIFVSRIFLEAFTMTFLAEWGDRSQLTTIILAAREDAVGVTLGAVIGHGICTTIAVVGGRIVAQRISVRSVTLIGGVVFLIFAVWALAAGPGS